MKWCLECHRAPEKYHSSARRSFQFELDGDQSARTRKKTRHANITFTPSNSPIAACATDNFRFMISDLRSQKNEEPKNCNPQPAIRNLQSFWRSLEEFSNPKRFRESARDEFQNGASDFSNFNRRDFLKFMGASLALASLPACTRQPVEKIVPYVKQPEELVPGKPLFFATAMTLGGFRHRPARRKSRRPSYKNRRQSRPSRQPRRHEHFSSGLDSRPLRS